MKILLLGEYSNVHATLTHGLTALGHEVTVASNGDFWKDYPRDIDLARSPGKWGGVRLMAKIYSLLPRLRGFDIVQLINPMFLELRAERILPIYKYLRRHNKHIILDAFGMDWFWVNTCCEKKPLRYSDFNIGQQLRTNSDALAERHDWLGTSKERLNRYIADDCDAIVTGLYEYDVCYRPYFPDKTHFIPFPIIAPHASLPIPHSTLLEKPLTVFIGISKKRSEYKGTDIMLRAAQDIKAKYPDKIELRIADGIPFEQYVDMMKGSDVILDQLYSYTPAMNALEAMARGIVVVGGGEPENYEIIHETALRPIINVEPNYDSVFHELQQLVLHPERLPLLQEQSIEYVRRHHDHIKVARQYEKMYKGL